MTNVRKRWSKEDTERLIQTHHLYTDDELAEIFNCDKLKVQNKKHRLGLSEKRVLDLPDNHFKCNICKEVMPKENFVKHKGKPHGITLECITCVNLRNNSIKIKKEKEIKKQQEKEYKDKFKGKKLFCNKCNEVKTIEDYYVAYHINSKSWGKTCKTCHYNTERNSKNIKLRERGY